MANLELLRCIAMMMVVVLHFLSKGGILGNLLERQMGSAQAAAWLLESFCITAVNLYMLISGYFLCESSFKCSRLLKLWLQIWVYSAGAGLLACALGIFPRADVGAHYLLTLLLPISMNHYWFMTAYVFLYLLLPFIGRAVRLMKKEQMQAALALLLFAFCVLKSLVPVRLEADGQGYDVLWYLCVFLTAAYIRRFGFPFPKKKRWCAAIYLAAVLAVFAGTMALRLVYLRTGGFEYIVKVFLEYNHMMPFLAAVGLFGVFLKMEVSGSCAGVINRIAPHTLGVYLLHENIGMRYAWQKWLGAGNVDGVGSLLFVTARAVLCVFAAGILVDMLRAALMRGLHFFLSKREFYRRITERVLEVDKLFADHCKTQLMS